MTNDARHIVTLDSTLRDGAQAEGIALSLADKLAIARTLDELGIDLIEGGNPASNPKDREFFREAASLGLKHAALCAFGATRRRGASPEEDDSLAALLESGTETVVLFGKCWELHSREILGVTREENREMIRSSCAFLTERGRRVIFDAEHFFDGCAADPAFAFDMLAAAVEGGAETLCLCDTNGGAFPEEVADAVRETAARFPGVSIGVHCHNDAGLAVAGTLAGVSAGASMVQGTLLGFGERCGNANLCQVIADLQLKRDFRLIPDCSRLTGAARAVAEICNVSIKRYEPYIGRSAFAHKAGMHADAVLKNPASYEQLPPESVGGQRRILVSEMSGRGALLYTLRPILGDLDKNSPETAEIIGRLKELEGRGYQFEGAHASLELLARRCIGTYRPHFELINYRILCTNPHDPDCSAAAMVKVRVGEDEVLRSAEGQGPVHALDKALRLALQVFYPQLGAMRLSDYKVRVMDSGAATAATVRVSITSSDGRREWGTVGVSQDIIEASFAALCDSIEYRLGMDDTDITELPAHSSPESRS